MLLDELLEGGIGDTPVFTVMHRRNISAADQLIGIATGITKNLCNLKNSQKFPRNSCFDTDCLAPRCCLRDREGSQNGRATPDESIALRWREPCCAPRIVHQFVQR
jgi:hypothetical protein